MMKTLAISALAFAAATAAATADEYANMPDVSVLPKDVVQVSPTVPMMGEHWANPATLPLGPIYCVHKGKVVCIEYMISQADFQAGKSWPELAGLKDLPSINHVDIGFQSHGHEGFEVPHYDIHIFFISREEVEKIQPQS